MTTNETLRTTDRVATQLAALVARFGHRFSNLDTERAGVSESVLFCAFGRGLVHIERMYGLTERNGYPQPLVTTYLVFA